MGISTVGFKKPSADLHKKSPRIFLLCLIVSILLTVVLITISIPQKNLLEDRVEVPPVIIHLEDIAVILCDDKRKPVSVGTTVLEDIYSGKSSEFVIQWNQTLPDDITIEDTKLDLDAAPEAPPALLVPGVGAAREESEIFEFFAVEEIPKKLKNVIPEYPEIAKRAGIEGTVTLKVLVNVIGVVDSVEVIEGPEVFIKSAMEAARSTKFTPAKHNDRDVACWVIMPFRFLLEN